MPLRRAGASVRELMIAAAAQKWNVPTNEVQSQERRVTARQVVAASRVTANWSKRPRSLPLPDPTRVPLKDESEFELIGHATPRVDIPSKVNGSARVWT